MYLDNLNIKFSVLMSFCGAGSCIFSAAAAAAKKTAANAHKTGIILFFIRSILPFGIVGNYSSVRII